MKPPNPALTVWTCGGLLDDEVDEEFPDDVDNEVDPVVVSGDDVMDPVAVADADLDVGVNVTLIIVQPCPKPV